MKESTISRNFILILCLIFLNNFESTATPDTNTQTNKSGNNPAGHQVIDASNSFSMILYSKLKSNTGNIVFSPYSIFTAMAMV